MVINWQAPGVVWFEHTGENVAITFCATMMGAIMATGIPSLSAVNWGHAFDVAGYAALVALLAAVVSSRTQKNGTASFLPRVVAKPRDSTGQ